MKYLKQILFFLIYSNLFIAACAVLMVQQSAWLFLQQDAGNELTGFVFFAALCSYNFHYYFTTHSVIPSERVKWQLQNRKSVLLLFLAGLCGSIFFFIRLSEYWLWLTPAIIATFLYSAPKIPHPLFRQLRKIAIGKTIFLAFVWMYVTSALPLLISAKPWSAAFTWYAVNRFFFIYCIAILFDYRDRADDKASGVRSLITFLNEKQITRLFIFSWVFFAATIVLLSFLGLSWLNLLWLMVPGVITAIIYNTARRNFSDLLYFVVLDGLMALSALLMLIAGI